MSDTTIGHTERLPWPRGTVVQDAETGRQGHLMGVIVELNSRTRRVVTETAYVRPVHGGREWSAPLERIKPVAVPITKARA
jgi:hypothetical protein